MQSVSYAYDALNRLYTVSEGGVTEATHSYDVNGNRASLIYANGNVTAYTYNLANWVTSVTNSDGAGTISAFSYSYYASGSQHTKTDHSGVTTTYTYDGLNRLTSESEAGGVTLTYAYDAAGNRTSLTATGTEAYTVAYTYDLNNRLLSETKTAGGITEATSYTYDANGSQLSRTTGAAVVTYAYDLFDRQTEVHTPTQIIQYAYNASGLRIEKRIGTNATRFLLDGANVAAEVNGSSAVTYLRGLNLLKREAGSTASYYLFNAHGDVVNLTDANGTSTKSYAYDAFGVEKNPSNSDANPFRYCGEYYDAETETYYLRARYYSPAGGRFTAEDPARDGTNYYAYAACNPILFFDPWGLKVIETEDFKLGQAGRMDGAVPHPLKANKYAVDLAVGFSMAAGVLADTLLEGAITLAHVTQCAENELIRSTYPIVNTKDYVYGQGIETDGVPYGVGTMDYNGCEVVAVHNSMITLGNPQRLGDVIRYFESGSLFLEGIFGTYITDIPEYFKSWGYQVDTLFASDTTMYSEFDAAFSGATTAVLSFYNSADEMSIHTLSISHSGNGGLTIYNLYDDATEPASRSSFYDLFTKNYSDRIPIVMYTIS